LKLNTEQKLLIKQQILVYKTSNRSLCTGS